jgi:hypothetical protein
MKRVALALAGAAVIALVCGEIASARGATVDTFPVGFVLTSGTCSNLPSGTTLIGTGTEKSVTTTRVDKDGVLTLENSTHGDGTAVDQNGNTYVWSYSNSFRANEGGGVFSGQMTDAFVAAGSGPAHLNNGFSGRFVTDFSSFFTLPNVTASHGDPIDFATGNAHCDPL